MSGAGWQAGDLALCVDDSALRFQLIRKGGLYKVLAAKSAQHMLLGETTVLILDGVEDDGGYFSKRFRKINPLSEWEHGQFEVDLAIDARDMKRLEREHAL